MNIKDEMRNYFYEDEEEFLKDHYDLYTELSKEELSNWLFQACGHIYAPGIDVFFYFIKKYNMDFDINAKNKKGLTALMVLARNQHLHNSAYLNFGLFKSNGADLKLLDNEGKDLKHHLKEGGNDRFINYFKNKPNKKSKTKLKNKIDPI